MQRVTVIISCSHLIADLIGAIYMGRSSYLIKKKRKRVCRKLELIASRDHERASNNETHGSLTWRKVSQESSVAVFTYSHYPPCSIFLLFVSWKIISFKDSLFQRFPLSKMPSSCSLQVPKLWRFHFLLTLTFLSSKTERKRTKKKKIKNLMMGKTTPRMAIVNIVQQPGDQEQDGTIFKNYNDVV